MTKELLIEILTYNGNLYTVTDNFINMNYGNDSFNIINSLYFDSYTGNVDKNKFVISVASLIHSEILLGNVNPEFISFLYTFLKS